MVIGRSPIECRTYLVDHHDRQQITDCCKEQPIQVMLDVLADPPAEGVKDHLADDEEEDPKGDMPEWPPILQRIYHQNDLHHHIDEQLDPVDQIQHDKQSCRVHRAEPRPPLESEQTDGKRDDKHAQAR